MRCVRIRARHTVVALAAIVLAACKGADHIAPPVPAKLAFAVAPGPTAAGTPISPPVQVVIQDAHGNTVTSATSAVTVTLGSNPAGATLSGTTTVNAVNGIATFSDLSIDKASVGYLLTASSNLLASATSDGFTVNAGAPAKLVFTVPPSATAPGAVITPPVEVAIEDAPGNLVTSATDAVTLALGTNPAGATLSGTTTVNAVNGVATFGNLSIDKASAGYALVASSGSLTSASSTSFTVAPPVPAKLAFIVAPSSTTTAGAVITPAVQVAIQDAQGKTVTGASSAVTVALGSNTAGATLSGTTTVNAVNGVATFGDLSIDKASIGYTLTASSGSLTNATSAAFTILVPPTGIHVTTTSTGASFPSSYTLSVDCDYYYGYGCRFTSPIAVNGSATVPLDAGTHYVQLDVADNCTVSGDAYRTITVNGPTDVPFNISCAGLGTVQVTTTTGGTDPTPDGYSVCIDRAGNDCYWHAQLRPTDAISIARVLAGSHTVTLTGVGRNCVVSGGVAHAVTVPVDATLSAPFDVSCTPTERIAFSSSGSIGMVHIDGTAARIITGTANAPAWSPDGSRLAYQCGQDICAINADGTSPVQVTSGGAGDQHPTWSPDGTLIVFASTAGGTTDLYVVDARGGNPVRLTQGVGVVGSPAWSPDGTQIAFDCQVDAGNFDICIVHSDGSGFARLTNDPASDYGPAWKPDGSMLAFTTTRFGVDEIVLMSPAGGSVTRIGAGLAGSAPTWSPDGAQLAFVGLYYDISLGPADAIFVANSNGSNVRLVTRGEQPAWRPHR